MCHSVCHSMYHSLCHSRCWTRSTPHSRVRQTSLCRRVEWRFSALRSAINHDAITIWSLNQSSGSNRSPVLYNCYISIYNIYVYIIELYNSNMFSVWDPCVSLPSGPALEAWPFGGKLNRELVHRQSLAIKYWLKIITNHKLLDI